MNELERLLAANEAPVKVLTLGTFEVWKSGEKLNSKAFGRDKSVQLFQFMLMARNRKALHKEQIVDRLWEDEIDDQGFKVALHGINKALEPQRKSHGEMRFVQRVGSTYQLDFRELWVDAIQFEAFITLANSHVNDDPQTAIRAYREGLKLYKGTYLPDRIYEDWSSDERERLQVLFLDASVQLAELLINENPIESIHYCQEALLVDVAWEEAYRIQMQAYLNKGNRPMALKTYQVCEKVLDEELGIRPLPATRKLYENIKNY